MRKLCTARFDTYVLITQQIFQKANSKYLILLNCILSIDAIKSRTQKTSQSIVFNYLTFDEMTAIRSQRNITIILQ